MTTNDTQKDINKQESVCDQREMTLSEETGDMDSPTVPRITEATENNTTMDKRGVVVTEGVACAVCEEDMGNTTTSQPVALPACGHTFCRRCLAQLLHTDGQHFRCPTCRTPHQGQDVASLPVNYLVLSLISTPFQNNKRNLFTESSGKVNIKGIIDKSSGEDVHHHNPQLGQSQKMEMKNMTISEGVERDTSSLHSLSSQNHHQGFDDKEHTLLGDVEGGRRRCQISRKQKMCLMVFSVVLVLVALGAGVAIGSAPAIINQLGFTEKGVARDTYASRLMSSTGKANNGTYPQDSMVAWLQKAGIKGLSREHWNYFGLSGAGVGLATAAVLVAVAAVVVVVKGKSRTRHRLPHSP